MSDRLGRDEGPRHHASEQIVLASDPERQRLLGQKGVVRNQIGRTCLRVEFAGESYAEKARQPPRDLPPRCFLVRVWKGIVIGNEQGDTAGWCGGSAGQQSGFLCGPLKDNGTRKQVVRAFTAGLKSSSKLTAAECLLSKREADLALLALACPDL